MLKLDKKDKNLLYLLDVNGRMNYSQLAKKTRLSKQLVKYRITKLEKSGIIKGYYAMIDTSKLGLTTFRTYLKLKNMTPENKKSLVDYLKKQKQIWAVVLTAGKWDIAVGISVKSIYGFYRLWEELLDKQLGHIKEYKTTVYSPIYHYTKAYITGEEDYETVRILGGQKQEEYDEKDLQILAELSKNARTPLTNIAQRINNTAELVSHRIKRLETKGIIQGYRAMIDVEKLGYQFYKAEIRLTNYKKIKQIMHYCHQHPNIYQVDKTIGGETLEVEFHVKKIVDMIDIITEIGRQFPETIESFDYLTVLTEEKMNFIPEITLSDTI